MGVVFVVFADFISIYPSLTLKWPRKASSADDDEAALMMIHEEEEDFGPMRNDIGFRMLMQAFIS